MASKESENNECIKCKQECLEEFYSCDSCLGRLHKKCSNISPSETRCMPLQRRVLLLICEECKKMLARLPHMMKLIDEMKHDLENIKSSFQNKTYADALQTNNKCIDTNIKTTFPTIIIKPKKIQKSEETKRDIQTAINPANLNIGIRSLKETKQGNIVVKCETEQDLKQLKEETEKKLNVEYEVEIPKKTLPKIKIAGFTGDDTVEILENKIRKQNKWIITEDYLKILYVRKTKNKNGLSTIYAECSGRFLGKILNTGKVCIDWQRLPVYEDLSVSRCYQCQGFRHKSSKCTKEQVCGNCAGDHCTLDCECQIRRCINCIWANKNYKTQHTTNHSALDSECPSLKYHLGIMKSKTDYST